MFIEPPQKTLMDKKSCYAIFQAHDSRFDGHLFIGVKTTGIYCRPVCKVKIPKQENCTFYPSAAAAETQGFRPCLRCRPELAPGLSSVNACSLLARKAAQLINSGSLAENNLTWLAQNLGITDRHLRRVFLTEYGVSPVQYLQTSKLLLAKSLLTDTRLPITEIALSVGFGSVRRFNDIFKTHYRLSPRDLRKLGHEEKADGDITLQLGYRPPYAWDKILNFLEKRAIPGVEMVTNNRYLRTVSLFKGPNKHQGWVAITNLPQRHALAITISPALLPVLPTVLTRTRALFDLNCAPLAIYEKLAPQMPTDCCQPGVRIPGCFDAFEMTVQAVLSQQITVKAARTLAGRLAQKFGEKLETPWEGLTSVFPGPASLTQASLSQLDELGLDKTKARSLLALGQDVNSGVINFHAADVLGKLNKLPGFDTWTVNYIAMRALNWPDAFPHPDMVIKQALQPKTEKEILALAEAWRPWRAYAAINLWVASN